MKTFIGVILVVVFCITQNDGKVIGSDDKPTKLTDLPLELLLDIFEDLDVNDLTGVARTHPYNYNAADIVFRNKFAIRGFDVNGVKKISGSSFVDNSNSTDEFNATLKSLETFGHLITKVSINYEYFNDDQIETINQHLNKYLTDSLTKISMLHCNESTLRSLTGPFKKVETVLFWGGKLESHFNFSEMFPVLRSIDFRFMRHVPAECFEYLFPNLEEIKMNAPLSERAFRLNPQLLSLSISDFDWDSLRMISEALPQLEVLEYRSPEELPPFEGEFIHFKNLKALLSTGLSSLPLSVNPIPFVLGNLEEIVCDEERFSRWLNIVIQNKNLRKIKAEGMKNYQYGRIFRELEHVEEFTFEFGSKYPLDMHFFCDLVNNSTEQLQKVSFCGNRIGQGRPQATIDELPDWEFDRDSRCFIFTRKV